jgi:DNA-binding response OmpR family regulator
MYMRHHEDVIGVLNSGVAAHLPQLTSGGLPAGSLLAMLFNQNRIEIAEPSGYQEEARTFVDRLAAPVCEFAVDASARKIRFRGDVVLEGKSFELFEALLPMFREGKSDGHEVASIQALDLANKLSLTDQSLRQQVNRLRKAITEDIVLGQGLPFDENDIIENQPGKGYRINPGLQEISLGDLLRK